MEVSERLQIRNLQGGEKMISEDKSFLIAGFSFNVMFFFLLMINVFITNAAGIALFIALATYIFFDSYFYKEKD